MRSLVWPLLALLVILHHDFWFWDDPSLVFDWIPVGLLYHVVLSIAAAGFWLFAVKSAWPGYLTETTLESADSNPAMPGATEASQA